MRRKLDNHWVENRGPIESMDLPLNMEIGFCWYQKRTNNKWTDNLTYRLMVYLRKIIALAFMTYIIGIDAYELHPMDEKVFKDFINRC